MKRDDALDAAGRTLTYSSKCGLCRRLLAEIVERLKDETKDDGPWDPHDALVAVSNRLAVCHARHGKKRPSGGAASRPRVQQAPCRAGRRSRSRSR